MGALDLLLRLAPLILSAIERAANSGSCPRAAIQEAMDSEEAVAIALEYAKFRK